MFSLNIKDGIFFLESDNISTIPAFGFVDTYNNSMSIRSISLNPKENKERVLAELARQFEDLPVEMMSARLDPGKYTEAFENILLERGWNPINETTLFFKRNTNE